MSFTVSQFERLLNISTLLTSTLELDPLLTKILLEAEALMGAEASNVMLLDRERGELRYEIALGEAGEKIKEQRSLKVGEGIAGWVAEHELPLLIEDAYKDSRFHKEFDKKTGFHTRSILCLPLNVHGRLLGIAQIINKKELGSFTIDDQLLFSKFCDIASVAIDNALMHKKLIEQDRVERDMELAEEIQRAFLPARLPLIDGLRIEYRSLVCRHVGGDVMDIRLLPDGRLSVLVADVSGKGVPAALFASKFSNDFDYQVKNFRDPAALFTQLNKLVTEKSTRGMYVTAVYGTIDPKSGEVELVNAGHLHPLLVGPASGQIKILQTGESPPLGILAETIYSSKKTKITSGQNLLFMTDGVTEAKSHDGSRLGDESTQNAAKMIPQLAVTQLMKTLNQFTQGEVLADDLTIVGVGFSDYKETEFHSDSVILAQIRRLVEEKTTAAGFESLARDRISLAVTEAVANVIKHTYQMKPDGRINFGVGTSGSQVHIHIQDWGKKQHSESFVSRDLQDIRPGGLGLHFMRETVDVLEFDDTHLIGNELHMLVLKK